MRRHLSRWHRRIGLISLFLLGWLSITGLILNHTEALGLDRPVNSALVAQWYGIDADCGPVAWQTAGGTISSCGESIFAGERRLDFAGPLAGAIDYQGLLVLAGPTGIGLFTPAGERVEAIAAEFLPGEPRQLGTQGDQLIIETPAGRFASDSHLSGWTTPEGGPGMQWPADVTLDGKTAETLGRRAAASTLNWTRIVQDMHSGRIIGIVGRILTDLGALSILVLAGLGLFLTSRR